MRARFINEMSVSSIKPNDVINKSLIDEWLSDSFAEELMIAAYAEETYQNYEDLLDDDEFKESKDFKNFVKYEIEYKFNETVDKFESLTYHSEKDRIDIWRVIRVSNNWLDHIKKEGKRLGIYWAYEEEAAEAHWGYNLAEKEIEVRIKSSVNPEHVDWVETIKLNMQPSYEEEKEIRLFKNTPLKIEGLEINGEKANIEDIKNKIFKA